MGLLRVLLLGLVVFLYVTSAEKTKKGTKKGGHDKGDHEKGGNEDEGVPAPKGGHDKGDHEKGGNEDEGVPAPKGGHDKEDHEKGGNEDEGVPAPEGGHDKGDHKKGGNEDEGAPAPKGGHDKGDHEKGGNEDEGAPAPKEGAPGGGAKGGAPGGGAKGGAVVDVRQYGAKGDGSTLDSPAFLKAWEQACSSNAKFPVLLIPKGDYVLSATEFLGPCNAPAVGVQILGNIISSPQKSHWSKCTDFISFRNINNLEVTGSGVINGNGPKWWANQLSCGKRPTNLALNNCKGVSVSGIHSKDSARNHMSISGTTGATISGITLTAPDASPNTDGIDISSSSSITIKNSIIGSGDDCVAINKNSKDIVVNGVKCGPGHGISIGSLGRGGELAQVENVAVSGCTFIKTDNGARIKTWKGGRGYVRNVVFRDITLVDVRRPIIIDQNYVDKNNPLANEDSALTISDVKFINFKGTCRDSDAITLECSNSGAGCTNVQLLNVQIQGASGEKPQAKCENASVKAMEIQPPVKCLKDADTLDYSDYLAMTETY